MWSSENVLKQRGPCILVFSLCSLETWVAFQHLFCRTKACRREGGSSWGPFCDDVMHGALGLMALLAIDRWAVFFSDCRRQISLGIVSRASRGPHLPKVSSSKLLFPSAPRRERGTLHLQLTDFLGTFHFGLIWNRSRLLLFWTHSIHWFGLRFFPNSFFSFNSGEIHSM